MLLFADFFAEKVRLCAYIYLFGTVYPSLSLSLSISVCGRVYFALISIKRFSMNRTSHTTHRVVVKTYTEYVYSKHRHRTNRAHLKCLFLHLIAKQLHRMLPIRFDCWHFHPNLFNLSHSYSIFFGTQPNPHARTHAHTYKKRYDRNGFVYVYKCAVGTLCLDDMAAKVTVATPTKFQLKPFQVYRHTKNYENQISFAPPPTPSSNKVFF